jgi:hypothetical protein
MVRGIENVPAREYPKINNLGGVLMANGCVECSMRKKAEANPKSLMSRIWRWHTTWCPGWKAYQKSLKEQTTQT